MVNSVGYEIYVRSFCDSDGDGIGDLKGLISKLDYLNDGNPDTYNDLGVNVIWLMPIFKSPSIHGYDQTDYYDINPTYGTLADFQEFLDKAHARGIKVIVDLVINHCSDQSTWFTQSVAKNATYKDWFVWTNETIGNLDTAGWQKPWGGVSSASDVWLSDAGRPGEYFYAAFSGSQPDLNLKNTAVAQEIDNIVTFWLNKGVDGFRLDAIRYLIETGPLPDQADTPETLTFLRNFQAHMKSIKSSAFTIGEVWSILSDIEKYYDSDQGVDMCFDFDAGSAVEATTYFQNNSYIYNYLNTVRTVPMTFLSPFLANHDQPRYPNNWDGDTNKSKVAMAILLTLPGMPFIYYGEEFGMMNSGGGSDLYYRSPMQWDNTPKAGFTTGTPWNNIGTNYDPYNVASQTADPNSQLNMVKKLVNLRTKYSALGSTNTELIGCSQNSIVTYFRKGTKDGIIVIINTLGTVQNVNLNFYDTCIPQSLSVQSLMKAESLTGITTGNYGAYPVTLQPYEVKLIYVGSVLDTRTVAPLPPPTVTLSLGEGFVYRPEMNYVTWIAHSNSNFIITANVESNGNMISRVEFWDYYYNFMMSFDTTPPYEFTYNNYPYPWDFGDYRVYAKVFYGGSSSISSAGTNLYRYSPYYESIIISNSYYIFRMKPTEIFYTSRIKTNTIIDAMYVTGEFTSWVQNSPAFQMILNGDFYEVTIASNICSGKMYKFTLFTNGNTNLSKVMWLWDFANYRYNSMDNYNAIAP